MFCKISLIAAHFHRIFISNENSKFNRVDDEPSSRQTVDEAACAADVSVSEHLDEYDVSIAHGTTGETHQMTAVQNPDENSSVDLEISDYTIEYLEDSVGSEILDELDRNAGAGSSVENDSVEALETICLEDTAASETLDELDGNAGAVSLPKNDSIHAVEALETIRFEDIAASEKLDELDRDAGAASLPENESEQKTFKMEKVSASLDETTEYYSEDSDVVILSAYYECDSDQVDA